MRFHQLHPGIAINAGMKGCGFRMSGPTREWQTRPRGFRSQVVIQVAGGVAFGVGKHGGGGSMTVEIAIA